MLHRYQFPRLAARFRDVRKPIPAVDEPAVVPRCKSSLIDEYSEAGGSRPAALSNQWGCALEFLCPPASVYALSPRFASIRRQPWNTEARQARQVPSDIIPVCETREPPRELGPQSSEVLQATKALHLGWHTTGAELTWGGSWFALCEVSHNDSSGRQARRRVSRWVARLAVLTHWPPGREEDMG